KGKKVVLNEKEFKAFQKDVHAKMLEILQRQEINYNGAATRHNSQRKINKDQWIVALVLEAVTPADEPDWKPALAALKKLKAAYSKKDYAGFEAAAVNAEKAVKEYESGVLAWCEGLIASGELTVASLNVVKDAGAFCATLAVVTVAAPATLPAAIAVGAASSMGVGLMYDGYTNASLAANGMKVMSEGEIAKRMLANGVAGAAGAAIAGNVIKLLKGPVVRVVTNNAFLKAQALRLSRTLPSKVFDKELVNVIKAYQKKYGENVSLTICKGGTVPASIKVEVLLKFLVRSASGSVSKMIGSSKLIYKHVLDWIKTEPHALSGDQKGLIKAAIDYLTQVGVFDLLFDDVVKSSMKVLQADLREKLEQLAEQELKKQKKAG
ncbi:MAG: hypothetical protein AB3N11_01565, partial [Arenibacterium sp.]